MPRPRRGTEIAQGISEGKYSLLVSGSTILAMTFKQHIHKSSWYEPDCQLASIGPREFNATQLHMTQCFQSRAYSMWKMVYKFALESKPPI